MVDPPGTSVKERVEKDSLFLDSAIVSHGFASFLRDYDVVIEVPAAKPGGTGSYVFGRYRYRFTHCPEALARTTVRPDSWQKSWDDAFTDYEAWNSAGAPDGYVWGVSYAVAYPGLSYIEPSVSAQHWTELLGKDMHEVRIATNALTIDLIFHELRVEQLPIGDVTSGAERTIQPLPE